MKVIGVIPARYHSSRLPGKPIVDICGRPMIWWVYQQTKKCESFDEVVIAVDDPRIQAVCDRYEMKSLMTSTEHDTPTSRLYEVSTKLEGDLYVLAMGDEPLIDARCFDLIIPERLETEYYVAGLVDVLDKATEVIDFSNQKVVTNAKGEAMLISRSPIPYPKGYLDFEYKKITGVQIFSPKALEFFNRTEKSILEKAEENDLMRFVEHGIPVKIIESGYKTISVDTQKDLEMVRDIIRKKIDGGEVIL